MNGDEWCIGGAWKPGIEGLGPGQYILQVQFFSILRYLRTTRPSLQPWSVCNMYIDSV